MISKQTQIGILFSSFATLDTLRPAITNKIVKRSSDEFALAVSFERLITDLRYYIHLARKCKGRNLAALLNLAFFTAGAQGNFSFSGLESVNFGVIDLSVASRESWGTDRLVMPGYFSAVNGASYIGSSDNHNINGYVKKYGNEPFVFPVGSGSDLRTLKISAPFSATDAYATAWIPGDPGMGLDLTLPNAGPHAVTAVTAPLVAVSTVGQWDWQVGDAGNLGIGTTGTGYGVTITVSIPDMTMFGAAADLRLAGWNGSSWIDLSAAATATGNTENSLLTGTMIPGITAIAIASTSIDLSSSFNITGSVVGDCSVQLQWKAQGSAGISRFVVQQSADGERYQEVSTLNASNFPTENSYNIVVAQNEFVDYYKLKIIYNNGSVRYSNIVAFQVNCGLNEKLMVYPNPVQHQQTVNVRIATAYRGDVRILLISDVGQRLQEVKSNITSAITVVPVNVWPYANGIYFISVIKKDGSRLGETQRLLKASGN